MKKTISTLLLSVASLQFVSVFMYEDMLHLVPRYEAGTIRADVERSQGAERLADNTAAVREALRRRVERNMTAIRRHVVCYKTPDLCSSSRFDWSL